MRPPPRLTISEWADAERRLSPESSAEPGRWSTSRAEYQRGFMDACSDPRCSDVVGVFASQTGKTDCVLNVIGFHVHHDPAPILVIQPTLEMAEAWSKDRFAPMNRDTPGLRGKIKDARSRDSGNTILHKTFSGGHLTAAGSNSPASLASRPIRILLCDEVDAYAPSAGAEGDPLKLAATRTAAFWNAKRIYISSPRLKGSPMFRLWERSDQRRYFVPCPECGEHQWLKWTQVKWQKDEAGKALPETAVYECEHCGAGWNDVQRAQAVRRGEWRATAPFRGTAGFHVNALAAPWESRRLQKLVEQWLEAQGNPELLKVFCNTVLAEWWSEQGDTVDETGLLERREKYSAPIPAGAAVLTIGVDVQKDRIEYEITGWGRGEESWLIRYGRIYGDPKQDPNVLRDLATVLATPLRHACGRDLYIRAGCIDTGGHATQTIYRWVRTRLRRLLPDGRSQFMFGIKGRSEVGRPVWPEKASRSKTPVRISNLWIVGVDAAKEQIYGRLGIAESGPGYCHFPRDVGEDYFKGLTAEHVITKYRAGQVVRVWAPKQEGAPNEPLDCRVYSYAALEGIRSAPFSLNLEAEVRKLEVLMQEIQPVGGAGAVGEVRPARSAAGRARRRVRHSGVDI